MTLDEQYALACNPGSGPGVARGMLTMTIGHLRLFNRIQHPLINEPASMLSGDLAVAWWIAHRSHEEASRRISALFSRLRIKSTGQLCYHSEEYATHVCYQLVLWRNYHMQRMDRWDGGASKGDPLPFLYVIEKVLMSEHGYRFEEVDPMPLRKALALLDCFSSSKEDNGGLVSDEQAKFMEEWRRIQEQKRGAENVS